MAAVAVLVGSTLLNAAYYIPIVYAAFRIDSDHDNHGEAPWPIVVAVGSTAFLTVLFFFWPDIPLALARQLMGLGR